MAFKPVSPPINNAKQCMDQAWLKLNKTISEAATAVGTTVDSSGFAGNLSVADTDVQAALETIDAMTAGAEPNSVANLTALALLAGVPTGNGRNVRSLKATWIRDAASVAVPDGITIIASVGGGNWIRQAQTDPTWASQPTWYVNSVTGNDEDDGATSGTAVKTVSEVARRMDGQGFAQDTTMWIETDCLDTDVVSWNLEGSGLDIKGIPILVTEATIDHWSKDIINGSNPGTISLTGWTASTHNGLAAYFVDGPAMGAWTWIASPTGTAQQARVGEVMLVSDTTGVATLPTGQPAVGNLVRVYRMPRMFVKRLDTYSSVRLRMWKLRVLRTQIPGSNYPDMDGNSITCALVHSDVCVLRGNSISLYQCSGATIAYSTVAIVGGAYRSLLLRGNTFISYNLLIDTEMPGNPSSLKGISVSASCTATTPVCYAASASVLSFFGIGNAVTLATGARFASMFRMVGSISNIPVRMLPGSRLIIDSVCEGVPNGGNTLASSVLSYIIELCDTGNRAVATILNWRQVPFKFERLDEEIVDVYAVSFTGRRSYIEHAVAANLAELSNAGINDYGETVTVRTLRCDFVSVPEVVAPDGITAISLPVTGTGTWMRLPQSDPHWTTQTDWYINPTSGDDENDGSTSITALASMAELCRRLQDGTIAQATTVWVEEDADATDVNLSINVTPSASFQIRGLVTLALTSTVGAWTRDIVTGVNPGTIEIAGLADPTPHIGRLITFTNGAASGRAAWLSRGVGGAAAYISPPYNSALGSGFPGFGDGLNVAILPRISVANLTVRGIYGNAEQPLLFELIGVLAADSSGCKIDAPMFMADRCWFDTAKISYLRGQFDTCSGSVYAWGETSIGSGVYAELLWGIRGTVLHDGNSGIRRRADDR